MTLKFRAQTSLIYVGLIGLTIIRLTGLIV